MFPTGQGDPEKANCGCTKSTPVKVTKSRSMTWPSSGYAAGVLTVVVYPMLTLIAFVAAALLVSFGLSSGRDFFRERADVVLTRGIERFSSGMLSEAALDLPPDCSRASVWASVDKADATRPPWTGHVARCSVRGYAIEALTPEVNFRARYTQGLTSDVEDKLHLLPWLLGARKDFSGARRKIYVDFGGRTFESSVKWMMHGYPLDFDEVHVFEVRRGVFQVPSPEAASGFTRAELARVHLHEGMLVGDEDGENAELETVTKLNATRWLLEELEVQPRDAVIVKMDIEGSEWPVLERWAASKLMGDIVDELFVEVHYGHPSMAKFGKCWDPRFNNRTRDDTVSLLHSLRANGIYAHAWP